MRARIAAIGGAVLLGIAAIALARGGEWAQHEFLRLYHAVPWAPLLVTPTGFVAVAWITRRYRPEARASGIPQVIAASHGARNSGVSRLVALPTAAFKFLATLTMLLVARHRRA